MKDNLLGSQIFPPFRGKLLHHHVEWLLQGSFQAAGGLLLCCRPWSQGLGHVLTLIQVQDVHINMWIRGIHMPCLLLVLERLNENHIRVN